ncbi:hypothetical protein Rsub_04569 [Raphidocelis subcapitata]|uniref:Uncharacterized protein n=1 Tax=Raphidocelis subcapitata TaxID=307507 RepID=A0A2V0P5W2_9CHLO|nr:hypothetical protein Rsub_04569 [Raphidocelis subcapitata]|eukprot:GBF92465.1 hypothetical protein Rsub_04569 [Raphidocelis subcapitata]
MEEAAAPARAAGAGAGARDPGAAEARPLLQPHPFKRAFVRRRSASWAEDEGAAAAAGAGPSPGLAQEERPRTSPFAPPPWLPRAREEHREWLDGHERWLLEWRGAEAERAAAGAAARARAPAGN